MSSDPKSTPAKDARCAFQRWNNPKISKNKEDFIVHVLNMRPRMREQFTVMILNHKEAKTLSSPTFCILHHISQYNNSNLVRRYPRTVKSGIPLPLPTAQSLIAFVISSVIWGFSNLHLPFSISIVLSQMQSQINYLRKATVNPQRDPQLA